MPVFIEMLTTPIKLLKEQDTCLCGSQSSSHKV